MNKKILLFCNGESGTGKTTFINNFAIPNGFHCLISATTRKIREGEQDGVSYYFRDEKYFETEKFATYLWVNSTFWKPGDAKWLYGIPEFEIYNNLGKNMVYDVIQPKYSRELMNWFIAHGLDKQYDFKVAFFTTKKQDNFETARNRVTMQNDMAVRQLNTCNLADFHDAGINIDYITMPRDGMPNKELINFVQRQK